jgi:type IV pilus assembly protein PilA
MASSTLRAGLRHRLIQQLAAKRHPSQSIISKGFTLIELLVVVIIVAILAGVALPSFLSQADKAKIASAKAMANAGGKECQVFLLDPNAPPYNGTFTAQTTSGDTDNITFTASCTAGTGGSSEATVVGGDTFTVTIDADGAVTTSWAE